MKNKKMENLNLRNVANVHQILENRKNRPPRFIIKLYDKTCDMFAYAGKVIYDNPHIEKDVLRGIKKSESIIVSPINVWETVMFSSKDTYINRVDKIINYTLTNMLDSKNKNYNSVFILTLVINNATQNTNTFKILQNLVSYVNQGEFYFDEQDIIDIFGVDTETTTNILKTIETISRTLQ